MEKKKTAYISLPITGRDFDEVCTLADIVKAALSEKYDVINPLDVAKKYPNQPWEWYLAWELENIYSGKIDNIVFCEGWMDSRGCRLEMEAVKVYNSFHNEGKIEINYAQMIPVYGNAMVLSYSDSGETKMFKPNE